MTERRIRVFYSELSGRFFATQYYKDRGENRIEVTGKMYDVTDDIGRAVTVHKVEFKVMEPSKDEPATDLSCDAILWHDRLSFDANVSSESPIINGTLITVSHVVSLIVDGWAWSDILRAHPELTEEDIRACLAYTVEMESL